MKIASFIPSFAHNLSRIFRDKGVLKDYLLRGYAFNQRLNQLEDKVDRRMAKTEADVVELRDKVDFFVQTSMPLVRGVFYNDQVFAASVFAADCEAQAGHAFFRDAAFVDDFARTNLQQVFNPFSPTTSIKVIERFR